MAEKGKETAKESMDRMIRYHVWASMGVGLVPLPVVDMVALTAIQLNMVRKIAKAYQIPFLKDKVKNVLGSLVGSAVPVAAGAPLAASVAKVIPVIGWTAGALTMPVFAGASTYAVAKVFVQHFASGGTFLTLDPEKVRDYYAEKLKEGKEVAGEGETLAADVEADENEKTEDIDAERERMGLTDA